MIELEGLTKRYGGTVAVDHLTFTVRPGVVTVPRAQRGREVHHHADDPRARPPHRRRRPHRRHALRPA
ncbi:hypothetical protein LT493_19825 [Streptomyces tricolor]|nr:hypothetical protein [Streptomyces tricolor]